MKEEAQDIGLQGKEISEYVTRQQTLDKEERVAWKDTQKRQTEDKRSRSRGEEEGDETNIAELQAEAKKRADESHIKIQIAQIRLRKNKPRLRLIKNSRLKRWSYKLKLPQFCNHSTPS